MTRITEGGALWFVGVTLNRLDTGVGQSDTHWEDAARTDTVGEGLEQITKLVSGQIQPGTLL